VQVPLFATRRAIEPLLPRVAERMQVVLHSGRYILGPELAAFEAEFAAHLGAGHCVGVANGTDALTIALRALGVAPGDDVVVPAVTFYATAEAVVNAGARPIFADVDPETWCLTVDTVEPTLTARTTAIVPVHLFGNLAPVRELIELARAQSGRRVWVLEDAAQAVDARADGEIAGTLGDAATFSFYPSKNLGAFGDAGAIVTHDDDVADACRLLRTHGSENKQLHSSLGYNSRLDELQAAALRVLLPQLRGWTRARREVAATYRELGLGDHVSLPNGTPGTEPCYHLYVVSTPERDALARGLAEREIGHRVYYTPPLHQQPGLAKFAPDRDLPGASRFAAECLALPMGPALERDELELVVRSVEQALQQAPVS
jgi:dTDP-3-amino-3,4,6-trideoxy-alpha-D-glucose transaminase